MSLALPQIRISFKARFENKMGEGSPPTPVLPPRFMRTSFIHTDVEWSTQSVHAEQINIHTCLLPICQWYKNVCLI